MEYFVDLLLKNFAKRQIDSLVIWIPFLTPEKRLPNLVQLSVAPLPARRSREFTMTSQLVSFFSSVRLNAGWLK